MVNLNICKKGGPWRLILWVLFFAVLIFQVISIIPKSWNLINIGFARIYLLIKWRLFIYVNFIIISILISSSSFPYKLNNLIRKIHKKSSSNISILISQTSQKFLVPSDDDTWWSRIGSSVETENFTALDDSQLNINNKEETISAVVTPVTLKKYEDKIDEISEENVIGDVEEEEFDTLDDTWKAIMDAKSKGNGPHLKKSGTWTAGDRGGNGGGDAVKTEGGRLERYRVELKKWSTFTRDVVRDRKSRGVGCSSVDSGIGGKGKPSGLTFHDELKKRADAFIARVTYDMRLQRMESDQRYLDMINRGIKRN